MNGLPTCSRCYRAADRSSKKIQQFHDWLLRESQGLSIDAE
jgi:LysR family transcriptional regulator, glycine cleavage system transcriptional activator